MNGVYLITSYPKSGNTWMRIFLNNYLRNEDQPADINQLEFTSLVFLRTLFDDLLGIDSAKLRQDELDLLRPAVYRAYARIEPESGRFWKIHDAYQRLPTGESLFPEDIVEGVIYVIRSPFDLAVSFAHHNHTSVDLAVDWMDQERYGLAMTQVAEFNQIHQRTFSWSHHVRSWVDEAPMRRLVVRYEDMFFKPKEVFTEVVRFVGLAENTEQIEKAIRFSSFDVLKEQELRMGFQEKPQNAEMFFRKGQVGDWRSKLSSANVEKLIHDHRAIMQRFGYLTSDDQIVY